MSVVGEVASDKALCSRSKSLSAFPLISDKYVQQRGVIFTQAIVNFVASGQKIALSSTALIFLFLDRFGHLFAQLIHEFAFVRPIHYGITLAIHFLAARQNDFQTLRFRTAFKRECRLLNAFHRDIQVGRFHSHIDNQDGRGVSSGEDVL